MNGEGPFDSEQPLQHQHGSPPLPELEQPCKLSEATLLAGPPEDPVVLCSAKCRVSSRPHSRLLLALAAGFSIGGGGGSVKTSHNLGKGWK